MEKDEIIKLLDAIHENIAMAYDCVIVLESIQSALKTHLTEMNYSKGFFTVTIQAVKSMLFIETIKLFDNSSDSCTINSILELCSKNIKDENMIKKISDLNEDFEKLDSILKNVRKQRHTFYAHNDKKYFLDSAKLNENYPVFPSDIKALLEFATKVYNELSTYYTNTLSICYRTNTDDLNVIINKLHEYEELNKQKIFIDG